MTNVGLANVPPPLDYNVLDAFQPLPRIKGVNAVDKGWNEFVLYGVDDHKNDFSVDPTFYYFYVGMTWDNDNGGVLDTQGAGRGLFFKNFRDDSVEGFFCTRENTSYFNWLCDSVKFSSYYWDPTVNRMPVNRENNAWWTCGVEDKNTYTQAQCR